MFSLFPLFKSLHFPIFLAAFEFHFRKTTRLLKYPASQSTFWHLHKKKSAVQPVHVPSIERSDIRTGQCLMNIACGVGFPI